MLVGKYQYKPPVPFVLCSEGSGVVTEAGSKSPFKVGDRVSFNAWTGGAAAEEIVLPSSGAMKLPPSMTFEQGAGFHVGYITAYHALKQRGELKAGETLLVTGAAGGMGVAAVQIGKLMGATVIAAAAGEEKLKALKALGADHVINYKTENMKDRVNDITGGKMADVIYDPVGGDIFDQCVRCIAGKGRLLVIGFASGRIPSLPVNLALIKGFSLVGVRAGAQLMMEPELARDAAEQLTRWAEAGRLVPHVFCRVPMARAAEAFGAVSKRAVIGKAVIVFDEPPAPRL